MINYDVINKYIVIGHSFNTRTTVPPIIRVQLQHASSIDRPKLGLISDMIHGECSEQTIKDIWLQRA